MVYRYKVYGVPVHSVTSGCMQDRFVLGGVYTSGNGPVVT